MIQSIIRALQGLPVEAITVIIASLPISELRGAIPAGLALGLTPGKAFILSVLGNMIPVLPILFLMEPVTDRLRNIPVLKKYFDWFFERTRRRAEVVQRYEALGLILFVAIPLPMTGAWTGCAAASLFKIKRGYAILSIAAGVLIAGVIVLSTCLFGRGIFRALFCTT
ncbi:MAG: small multi-drug export protein [Candidatus Omnitrophota bacterium]